MAQLSLLFAISSVLTLGKLNTVFLKKGYKEHPEFDALTGVWLSYVVCIVSLTLYIMFNKKQSWNEITTQTTWDSSKWFVVAGLFSTAAAIMYMPLLKSLQYSRLSLLKSPLNMVLTIIISILFLNESLNAKSVIALMLYLSIPFILEFNKN